MKPILTANWRYLAVASFVVDPKLLSPFVVPGTEIDDENGETFISIVGFLFFETRLPGEPPLAHPNFVQLHLCYYARQKSGEIWRRGIVIVRQFVVARAVPVLARVFPGQRYLAVPLQHHIEEGAEQIKVEYFWRHNRKQISLSMLGAGMPQAMAAGSHAEFITERNWLFTHVGDGSREFQIAHPRWKIWMPATYSLKGDLSLLQADVFAETVAGAPRSAFIVDGSPVQVRTRSGELVE